MQALTWLVAFVAVAVAAGLWSRARHRRAAAIGALAVAVATGAASWGIALHVASLPRSAQTLEGDGALVHEVLAHTPAGVFLAGRDVVRLSLASSPAEIVARYPLDEPLPVVTSVAWSGDVLLATYHGGPDEGGWAALDRDGWVVEPHLASPPLTNIRAEWNDGAGRFVVSTVSKPEGEPDQREAHLRHVNERGEIVDTERLRIGNYQLRADTVCEVGGERYATDMVGRACRLARVEGSDVWGCVASRKGAPQHASCPTHVSAATPTAYLGPGGVERRPAPPARFFEGDPVPAATYVRYGDGPPRPSTVWHTKQTGYLASTGGGFVSVRHVGEQRAARRGHVEREAVFEHYDAAGERTARTYVRRFGVSPHIFTEDGEVVAFDSRLSEMVRLDAQTLQRKAAPGAVRAVVDRLSVWGGRSYVFDGALAFALSGVVLLLVAAPVLAWRARRGAAGRVTVQRVSLAYLVVSLPALVELVSSAWHL